MHRFLSHQMQQNADFKTFFVKYGSGDAVGIETHFTVDGMPRGRALESVEHLRAGIFI